MLKKLLTMAAWVLCYGLAAPIAHAITLSALFAGEEITVGDKRFFDFSGSAYSRNAPELDFGLVEVTALGDQPMNPGLRFEIADGVILDGQGGPDCCREDELVFTDFEINYRVAVLDANYRITGSSLALTGSVVGCDAPPCSSLSETTVTVDSELVNALDVHLGYFSVVDDLTASSTSNSFHFAPTEGLRVTTFVLVQAILTGEHAAFYSFEQRFSQVAEPAALALFGLGLAGLAATRRRKQ